MGAEHLLWASSVPWLRVMVARALPKPVVCMSASSLEQIIRKYSWISVVQTSQMRCVQEVPFNLCSSLHHALFLPTPMTSSGSSRIPLTHGLYLPPSGLVLSRKEAPNEW